MENNYKESFAYKIKILENLQNMYRDVLYIFLTPFYLIDEKRLFVKKRFLIRAKLKKTIKLLDLLVFKKTWELILCSKIYSDDEIAKILVSFYQEFQDFIYTEKIGGAKKITVDACEKFNAEDYPIADFFCRRTLRRLLKMQDRLSDLLVGFYIHGSFASGDHIRNWSDLDLLMIIKKSTLLDKDKLIFLKKLNNKISKISLLVDPLQLHGSFVISEFDMDYYPQTYFPLILFQISKSVFSYDVNKDFFIRDCETEKKQVFYSQNYLYFKKIMGRSVVSMTPRELKLFMHRIFIFPTFFLQAMGEHCIKKNSFDIIKKYFDKASIDILDRVSIIMRRKRDPLVFGIFRILNFGGPLMLFLVNRTLRKRIYFGNITEDFEVYKKEARFLLEEAKSKLALK